MLEVSRNTLDEVLAIGSVEESRAREAHVAFGNESTALRIVVAVDLEALVVLIFSDLPVLAERFELIFMGTSEG
jgi:hypothetical protein